MKISKLEEEHLRKTGENISLKELERKLKVSKEEIIVAQEAKTPVESIYKEDGNDDKGTMLIDKIAMTENEENTLINRITVNQLIENLEPKERQIIMLRFYRNKTQSEVRKITWNITSTSIENRKKCIK